MRYAVEWMGSGVVFVYGIVLLLLLVPEFAAIAVVVATIAVLVVALAALVGLVALAAAALASPYLLVRSVRRRLAQRSGGRSAPDPARRVDPSCSSACGLGRAHVTAFAHDEPDEAGAILEDATRDAA
jgi:hypothetical protein